MDATNFYVITKKKERDKYVIREMKSSTLNVSKKLVTTMKRPEKISSVKMEKRIHTHSNYCHGKYILYVCECMCHRSVHAVSINQIQTYSD